MAVFLLLSATISFAPWPYRAGRYGVVLAMLSWFLSLWLWGQLQSVSGSWFALSQKFTLLARESLFPEVLGPSLGWLAVAGLQGFPSLAHEFSMALVWMFLYLLLRLLLTLPLHLWQRRQPLPPRPRRLYRPWRSGLTLLTMLLALPLALLPVVVTAEPAWRAPLSSPLWVSSWIVLLELRLWVSRSSYR